MEQKTFITNIEVFNLLGAGPLTFDQIMVSTKGSRSATHNVLTRLVNAFLVEEVTSAHITIYVRYDRPGMSKAG